MPWTHELTHDLAPGAEIQLRRLHNGLGLVVLPDHGAPIVTYQTWYGVGSRHEHPGRTGMAHLFEHLMFNQTARHPAGEFDRLIETTGGDSNAATWVDWTFYRDSVPARDLGLVVELEADRMANLVLEPPQLESEREVVANERMQRVDDDIEGFADEELMRLAFHVHPYRWPTIGWMEDIRAIALEDVRAFYRTFYAPNNATVVVVGAVDPAEVMKRIESAYGGLSAAELPPPPGAVEPEQDRERRARFAKPTAAPRLLCGYRAVGQGHPDWPALSMAAALLSGGPSSRLYRRLVAEKEIATHVDCDVAAFRDPGLFRISLAVTRDHTADQALAEVDDLVRELAAAPVPDQELDKVRSVVETDFWAELDSVDGRAEALGHYQTVAGDFRRLFDMAGRLARVTAEEVERAVRTYLVPARRSIIMIDPDGSGEDGDE